MLKLGLEFVGLLLYESHYRTSCSKLDTNVIAPLSMKYFWFMLYNYSCRNYFSISTEKLPGWLRGGITVLYSAENFITLIGDLDT